jgi:hypothetical protein
VPLQLHIFVVAAPVIFIKKGEPPQFGTVNLIWFGKGALIQAGAGAGGGGTDGYVLLILLG